MENSYREYCDDEQQIGQESLLVDIDISRGGYSDGKSLQDIPL